MPYVYEENKLKGGRPRFVENESKVNFFLEYIRCGSSMTGACKGVGTKTDTIARLIKQGEKDREEGKDTKEANFVNAYEAAQSEFEVRNLKNIQQHSEREWKASAWLLERRMKKEYALVQQVEVSAPEKIEIKMDVKPDGESIDTVGTRPQCQQ